MKKKLTAMLLIMSMVCTFLPVSAMAAAAESVDGNEAAVVSADGKKTEHATLQEAINAAKDGETVVVLKDITLNNKYADDKENFCAGIENKSLTIDGQGQATITCGKKNGLYIKGSDSLENLKTVTFKNLTIENTVLNGRCVGSYGGYVTLNVNNVTLKTTGGGNTQPITIGGDHSNLASDYFMDVNVKNSTIEAGDAGYGIIVFNPVNLTIDDSDITGYAALYMKNANGTKGSAGSQVYVTNESVLTGNNPHKAGSSSSFATIAVDDPRIVINIEDSKVVSNATGGEEQYAFSFQTPAVEGSQVTITGNSSVELKGELAFFKDVIADTTITSGTFTKDGAPLDVSEYLADNLTQDSDGNVVELNENTAAAMVDGKLYRTFAEATAAVKDGSTFKLLQSTTVDTWNQVWNAKDLTIDGNGKNLTVGKVESNGNGDFLFYSAENLNVSDLNVVFNGKGNGFDMTSGSLTNVKMTGADKATNKYAVFVGAGDGKVSINGCTFKNFGMGVYSQPTGQPTAAIAVDNSTFDNCDYPLVSYAADTAFTDNNVQNSGEISFAAAADSANNAENIKYTVTGNTLQDAGKVWFYGGDLNKVDFEKNKVLGNTKVDTTDAKADTTLDVSNNYWGGQAPSKNQLVGGSDAIKGDDVYYEADTMQPEDLNTYEPSTGGGVVTRYDVTLADTDNGTITATHKRASKNSTVTITTTPDEGYVVDAVTVTEKDGDKVEVTKKDDNKYTFKMPASDVTVKATFKAEQTEPEQPSGLPFTDVAKDAWYFPAVEYVFNNGLMNGTTATTFAPNVNLNRAMMAAVLYNMEGGPACDKSGLFSDVADGKWYTDAVNWAASNNIVSGMPDGTYAPDQALTREQMASILYRYAEYKGIDVSARADLSTFTDGTTVSPWAQDVVQWAVAEKLMSGNGNELQPKGTASRAQVATVLMNYCENVAK